MLIISPCSLYDAYHLEYWVNSQQLGHIAYAENDSIAYVENDHKISMAFLTLPQEVQLSFTDTSMCTNTG